MENKFRLPEGVRPVNYDVTLDVNLKNFRFKGGEFIQLEIKEPTNEIKLNSVDLKINICELTLANKKKVRPEIRLNEEKEQLILKFQGKVSGKAELFINFEGTLSETLAGFYRSKYEHDGETKYLATTQFEPADARRALPCFDEPDFKATFEVSFLIDPNLQAISNTPTVKEEKSGNKKLVKFAKTPLMSTYLLYLGVGEFEFLEGNLGKTKIRIATTPGKKQFGEFALDCTKKFLKYYNDYFGIPYPLPKLDQIAIPDFAAGAMENWGAITYKEAAVLFDPKTSSTATKQAIADTIAHELAHQWFGNLVTMKWWNDLWLNESFATWIGYKTVDKFFPEWDMWSQFVDEEVGGALGLDSLKTSHPIEADVKQPHEVSEIFDEISYNKGASILRMLESHLGEETFRKGLRDYMLHHKYGNATTLDLWSALGKVSNAPVKKMMASWTGQTGYPVIDAQIENSKLILTQKRFLLESDKDHETTWMVPIKILLDSGEEISVILDERKKEVSLKKSPKWFKVNFGQTGFYRVKYPEKILRELKPLVKNKKLGNRERWGLQNDLYALTKATEIPFAAYLEFINAYLDDDDYLVSLDVSGKLSGVYFMSSGKLKKNLEPTAAEFNQRIFARLGWETRKGEKENDAILRASTIFVLGRMGNKDILNESTKRFQYFLNSPNSLRPDLRSVVYQLAAWASDSKMYKTLIEQYTIAKSQEEQRRFLRSLAGFKSKELIEKALAFALSSQVRAQDTPIPVAGAAGNPNGKELVWIWFKKNWHELKKRYGEGGNVKMLDRMIGLLGILTDIRFEKELKEFFDKDPCPGTEMGVRQTLEVIRINYRFLKANSGL